MKKSLTLLLIVFLGLSTWAIIGCGGGGDGLTRPPAEDPINPQPIPNDFTNPAPPRNVTAIPGDRSALLSWEKVYTAVGYNVYQSSDGITFIRLSSGVSFTENSATIGNLINGRTYYFGVSAVDEQSNESGIAYVGGDGRNPTAFPVVPYGYVPPTQPEPPSNFDWTAGDRKVMLSWDPSPSTGLTKYRIIRKMHISEYANVPGSNPTKKAQKRAQIEAIFNKFWDVDPSIAFHTDAGKNLFSLTIPPGPYYIDRGVWPVGLPPNYLPLGLAQGDILYEYKLFGWFGCYSLHGGTLNEVVPLDWYPDPPVITVIKVVPKKTGTGIGVYLVWRQALAPENSDVKEYYLSREVEECYTPEGGTTPICTWTEKISIIINAPFNLYTPTLTYQDDSVVTGKKYRYKLTAVDYTGHESYESAPAEITTPGG